MPTNPASARPPLFVAILFALTISVAITTVIGAVCVWLYEHIGPFIFLVPLLAVFTFFFCTALSVALSEE